MCPALIIDEEEVQPTYIPVEGGLRLSIPGRGLTVGNALNNARITLVGDKLCSDIKASNNTKSQEM